MKNKKAGAILLNILIPPIIGTVIALLILIPKGDLTLRSGLGWGLFFTVNTWLLLNTLFINKVFNGKLGEIIFFLSTGLLISVTVGFIFYALFKCNFNFSKLNWYGFLNDVVTFDALYYGIVFLIFVGFVVVYATLIDRNILKTFRNSAFGTNGKLKQVESNLENSRWMNMKEKEQLFKTYKFSQLDKVKKDGIPIGATLINKDQDLNVMFNSPCHSLVIGSTGSGKTTTFVSPMIQILGATAAGSSMIVTDPKGELYALHSKFLDSRGYDVKVIDLRDTYSSDRWNPLDSIWDNYQKYLTAHKNAFIHVGKVGDTNLRIIGDPKDFETVEKWYEFDGKAFSKYENLVESIKVYKKKIYDEVYEDLNDLCSVLIPVENEKDPMWEKGARSITLAVLLAMLEDAAKPENNMTKDKFNFFNMTKILQNSNKDYEDLRNYFKGRSPLSKALSLSKQVCDAATQTRASYMSIVYEKLTMFNDAGICSLTSASDFNSEQMADKPTALFLKIPDEKDTRHNLAAIFILNIYKTLIKIASAKESLSLDRNVYFIMDEFGNMPKIEKFDKFITVGRSRKIWFTMIIQSYAQLNNVYGDTVADIVKGNCGIKMFIGSNDMETCKEYSELCGNITVVTNSVSYQGSTEQSSSQQTQVRPLIYPSELQRLNHPGDIGHSIIVTFGNYPLKTYFSPSFKVPLYKMGKMDNPNQIERYFDETKIFYDVKKRNELVQAKAQQAGAQAQAENKDAQKEEKKEIIDKPVENKDSENVQNEEKKDNLEKPIENKNQEDKKIEGMKSIEKSLEDFLKANPDADLKQFFEYMAKGGNGENETK